MIYRHILISSAQLPKTCFPVKLWWLDVQPTVSPGFYFSLAITEINSMFKQCDSPQMKDIYMLTHLIPMIFQCVWRSCLCVTNVCVTPARVGRKEEVSSLGKWKENADTETKNLFIGAVKIENRGHAACFSTVATTRTHEELVQKWGKCECSSVMCWSSNVS